jgi:hypothetical protein
MGELTVEGVESSKEASGHAASVCPVHATDTKRTSVEADDELVFPKHKRVVTIYAPNASGESELHIYYGEKEIVFDEPELFAFGEGLAKQSHFIAKTAATWGQGYDWPRVQELLEQLLEEGILQRASAHESEPRPHHGPLPSPLLPACTTVPRTWFDCEAITRELTGRPLEHGYLELIVPIYRVAHMAVDAEGRQVGEANVFPRALRLDVPTEWQTCPYPGSRYHDEFPMNVTALKSMNKYWKPMMVALRRIRQAYLRRFPQASQGWTVGDLDRLSTLVLTLPAYLLMHEPPRVKNGQLHPLLSSMFRITDGVRMTMHHMLFTFSSESPLPIDAPMTSTELYAYAERNNVFLSDYGVCAGPRTMIEEFLRVFIDGKLIEGAESLVLDAPVQSALAELNSAFDYTLYGIQAYAVVFSLWVAMSRTYERLLPLIEACSGDASDTFLAYRERFQQSARFLRTATRLGTEEQRASLARVYADMYAQCASGLATASSGATLAERLTPVDAAYHVSATNRLRGMLQQRFYGTAAPDGPALTAVVVALMDYFRQEQAIVRVASEIQAHINRLLGRTSPTRPFTASDVALYFRLQEVGRRLPYLVDELEEELGLHVVVSSNVIDITDRAAV